MQEGLGRVRQVDEVCLNFKRDRGSDRPVFFGFHATNESAWLDCPVDLLDPDDPDADALFLVELDDYVELWEAIDD